jgi:hypothetical protein
MRSSSGAGWISASCLGHNRGSQGYRHRFVALMDRHLPRWRAHNALLAQAPLAHDEWVY